MFNQRSPFVAVGGIGGSGTRLVCELLKHLGINMGQVLNPSNDNILFTYLFKNKKILDASDDEFSYHYQLFNYVSQGLTLSIEDLNYLKNIVKNYRLLPLVWAEKLLSQIKNPTFSSLEWGWKEPNTHIVIDQIIKLEPKLKFIYVKRSALDMALSKNQNQLKLWGEYFLQRRVEVTPRDSLAYWCHTQKRMNELAKKMQSQFYLLDYDFFCQNPVQGISQLSDFLGFNQQRINTTKLVSMIKPADTYGRGKQLDLSLIDKYDLNFLKETGEIARAYC